MFDRIKSPTTKQLREAARLIALGKSIEDDAARIAAAEMVLDGVDRRDRPKLSKVEQAEAYQRRDTLIWDCSGASVDHSDEKIYVLARDFSVRFELYRRHRWPIDRYSDGNPHTGSDHAFAELYRDLFDIARATPYGVVPKDPPGIYAILLKVKMSKTDTAFSV